MPRVLTLSTFLDAPPDKVWDAVNEPRLFLYVAHPVVTVALVDPQVFPDHYDNRAYVISMRLFGILPIGRQTIDINRPAPEGGVRLLHDKGHSALIHKWDHLISVAPEGDGTRYTDRVEIDAGLLTPVVFVFARWFFGHRHRRWHKLIANGFDYSAA